jgi:hypothetical protein
VFGVEGVVEAGECEDAYGRVVYLSIMGAREAGGSTKLYGLGPSVRMSIGLHTLRWTIRQHMKCTEAACLATNGDKYWEGTSRTLHMIKVLPCTNSVDTPPSRDDKETLRAKTDITYTPA